LCETEHQVNHLLDTCPKEGDEKEGVGSRKKRGEGEKGGGGRSSSQAGAR
jgi:hypothetical protein